MIQAALKLSRVIDAVNDRIGRWSMWLILAMTLLSAGNAVIRKAFDYSSNALLEAQWYMFSAVFLLCAGHALLHNEHIRIDLLSSRYDPRTRAWFKAANNSVGPVFTEPYVFFTTGEIHSAVTPSLAAE